MRNAAFRMILVLAALMTAAGAFAQDDVYSPDFGIGPGGGSGGNCSHCTYYGNQAECSSLWDDSYICESDPAGCRWVSGFSLCQVYNAPIGPPFCQVSGSCSRLQYSALNSNVVGQQIEDQIAGIETFLRQTPGVISDADLNDFIAVTDYGLRGKRYALAAQERLAAYRAEFNRLVARGDPSRELKPGAIPVTPHKPVKNHPAVTASLSVR